MGGPEYPNDTVEIYFPRCCRPVKLDVDDYVRLKDYRMYFSYRFRDKSYIKCRLGKDGRLEYLHRLVMNITDFKHVDHINQDKLDNRKSNLRIGRAFQNGVNRKPKKGGTSQYKGVHLRKDTGKWQASVCYKWATKNVGSFDTEIEAAKARDEAVKKLPELKGFVQLNFAEE